MGQNLIMNAADHGFNVIVFNRTVSKVDHFLENEAKGMSLNGSSRLNKLLPYPVGLGTRYSSKEAATTSRRDYGAVFGLLC